MMDNMTAKASECDEMTGLSLCIQEKTLRAFRLLEGIGDGLDNIDARGNAETILAAINRLNAFTDAARDAINDALENAEAIERIAGSMFLAELDA